MPYRPFGDAPVDLAQDVRASPPSPSQANLPPPGASAQQLARKMPVRASPRMPPREVNRGTFQKVPIQMVLQAGGMNGAPIQASNINGAPVMVDPMERPGSLAAVNMDTSVSAQVRGAKMLGALRADGVQVSGDYTDAIRNAAGFAFGPPRLPKQGYAAASYSYPAKQMVVGATLAGKPIVNPMPTRGASPAAAPKLVTRGGIRGQISSSPSEDRRRLISTLQGLSAAPNVSWVGANITDVGQYGKADWGINIRTFIDSLPDYVPAAVRDQAKSIAGYISAAPVPWSFIANNIGTSSIAGKSLPSFVKEAYLKWAYKLTWGTDISLDNLKRAMTSTFVSAQNLAATVAHPSYDPAYKPPAPATPPPAPAPQTTQVQTATFTPAIITKPPTQSTLVNQILTNTAASGQVSLPPQMASNLPTLPPVVRPPALPAVPQAPSSPAAPASNTMLYVGGAVALAAVIFVATRK